MLDYGFGILVALRSFDNGVVLLIKVALDLGPSRNPGSELIFSVSTIKWERLLFFVVISVMIRGLMRSVIANLIRYDDTIFTLLI
jgi:hypothetical protein